MRACERAPCPLFEPMFQNLMIFFFWVFCLEWWETHNAGSLKPRKIQAYFVRGQTRPLVSSHSTSTTAFIQFGVLSAKPRCSYFSDDHCSTSRLNPTTLQLIANIAVCFLYNRVLCCTMSAYSICLTNVKYCQNIASLKKIVLDLGQKVNIIFIIISV